MDIRPIRNDEDYRKTLHEIDQLMSAELGTPEGERLDVLSTLVEAWERKHFPLDLPDPGGILDPPVRRIPRGLSEHIATCSRGSDETLKIGLSNLTLEPAP